MSRWFRYYDEALNDPKVQKLSGDLFKSWINLLCLASKSGGAIPSAAEAAFALRVSEDKARVIVAQLAGHGLLDATGGYFEPHNWPLRQFKSDGSNERVKRFRERYKKRECNVTETVNATGPDTDTDTEEESKQVPRKRGRPKVPLPDNWHPMEVLSSDDSFELERFKNHARANDRRCVDWFAAWRNWKTSPYRKTGVGNGTHRESYQERHSLSAAFDKLDAALDEQIAHERREAEAGDLPCPPNLRLLPGGSV